MSDDSNGRYSLPPGYIGVTGQTILTSQHNPPLEDIAAALTNRLPRAGTAPMLANLPMGGFKVTGLGNGSAADDAATYGQLSAILPLGVPLDYLGTTAPPGWAFCYGQALSRATYSALFAVLGTTYGAGDGSTTFNIPDFRGRVAAGKDDMGGTDATRLGFFGAVAKTLGGALGIASHVLTTGQMPSHNHGGNSGSGGIHSHPFSYNSVGNVGDVASGGGYSRFAVTSGTTDNSPSHTHPIASDGSDQAHPNAQPTIIVNKIIRTGI